MAVIPEGCDVRATVGAHTMGRHDPTHRLEPTSYARAMRTPDGPGTVLLSWTGRIERLDAWGPGGGWLADQLPELLGASDDPPEELPGDHPVVRRAHRHRRGLRVGANRDPLPTAVAAVCGQRVTGIEARRSYAAIIRRTSEPAPGPLGLWLPPDPARLATLPSHEYHRCGVDARRGATIARLGARAIRVDEVMGMDAEGAFARMTAFPGVGPWSAGLVAALARGDADAVLVGDYGIPALVAHALAGEPDGGDERMLELLEPFRPHRWRVVRLLELSGTAPPRRAPRARILDLRTY